ncbi:hypothetical protein SAMN05428947_10271 [Mucilaginibacter sp. OK283]|nr:hypothetical protein SAMN05428947_10271 [Mucilaginibacter sp. OK283]
MFCGLRNYFVETTTLARSWPREGLVPFVLSKGTKTAVTRNASLRSWPLPCKTGKTWAGIILPRHTLSLRTCKNFLCPAAAPPRIVLPVFARSCSADTLGNTMPFRIPKALFPIPSLGRGAIAMRAKAGRG